MGWDLYYYFLKRETTFKIGFNMYVIMEGVGILYSIVSGFFWYVIMGELVFYIVCDLVIFQHMITGGVGILYNI